jgi:helix-turn-helix protein
MGLPNKSKLSTKLEDVSFIHSTLDDAGLKLREFRVYCHVSRRAGLKGPCWAALDSMAEVCGMSEATVRKALKALVSRRLLHVKANDGRRGNNGGTNHYYLTHPSIWIPTEAPLQKNMGGKKLQGRGTKKLQGDPLQKVTPKGIPSEGIPIKGEAPALSATERISAEKELGRVQSRIKELLGNCNPRELIPSAREAYGLLEGREYELKALLGVKY